MEHFLLAHTVLFLKKIDRANFVPLGSATELHPLSRLYVMAPSKMDPLLKLYAVTLPPKMDTLFQIYSRI